MSLVKVVMSILFVRFVDGVSIYAYVTSARCYPSEPWRDQPQRAPIKSLDNKVKELISKLHVGSDM